MKNYGLLEQLYETTAYILGNNSIPWVPYNPSGNWELSLPRYENQTTKNGEETSGCTVWGSQNQIETLYRMIYGTEPNYSERFTYLQVPVTPGVGANPQDTYECIRKCGLVDDADLPMTSSIVEYIDSSDITPSLKAKGQNWLVRHDFRHEWLWRDRPDNYMEVLKEALQTSPIGVSVSAWQEEVDQWGNMVYVSRIPRGNNHWCLLYKFDEQGYPWVFDSYDHSKKRLAKDHVINRAKRIWINKRTRSAMPLHIKILKSVVNRLMNKKTLLDVAQTYLGKDVTPLDKVKDTEACAETLSTLMNIVDPTVKVVPGTATLLENTLKNPKWKEVFQPESGDVCIAPSGYGNGKVQGHCWVVMKNGLFASNNSFGVYAGIFTENYTLPLIQKRYGIEGKLPIRFFRFFG